MGSDKETSTVFIKYAFRTAVDVVTILAVVGHDCMMTQNEGISRLNMSLSTLKSQLYSCGVP